MSDFIKPPSQPQCDGLKANTNPHYIHSTALKMSLFPYRSGVFAATFFIIMFIISINFHFSRHLRGAADAFQHLQGKLAIIAFPLWKLHQCWADVRHSKLWVSQTLRNSTSLVFPGFPSAVDPLLWTKIHLQRRKLFMIKDSADKHVWRGC